MKLTGLHLLLTYECNFECDHCFVWSGPWHTGTMTLAGIEEILRQARDVGTIEWIYFEGGEPFLYHALLRRGVRRAAEIRKDLVHRARPRKSLFVHRRRGEGRASVGRGGPRAGRGCKRQEGVAAD